MGNKKLNRKGFTLVELLAVIVVLAIILVITVPMILNTLGSAKSDSFDASLNTVVNYYREQLSLASLGRAESSVLTDTTNGVKFSKEGKLCDSGKSGDSCATGTAKAINIADDFGKLGMQEDQYDNAKCTVQWDANGKVTVHLEGATGGEFAGLKGDKSK